MARTYGLRNYNIGGDKRDLGEVVGKRLDIKRLTRTSSQRYGDGMEILANIIDQSTGEVLSESARFVTFSGPVVRDCGQVLQDADTHDFGEDALAVIVTQAGQAYVFEDLPAVTMPDAAEGAEPFGAAENNAAVAGAEAATS